MSVVGRAEGGVGERVRARREGVREHTRERRGRDARQKGGRTLRGPARWRGALFGDWRVRRVVRAEVEVVERIVVVSIRCLSQA